MKVNESKDSSSFKAGARKDQQIKMLVHRYAVLKVQPKSHN
tara:strand:- start:303 stop:425 length:123 start_codon:yes stop_codon:yes gene_type:complete